ncbi:methylenetetrahydrofolate reductase [Arthrobacter sp. 35W]|uniref:methylenetetrahydrofolate reductase n=1 Tax=Arthrobacter sp. 35W TaxID=1132441 RepID=UPI0003F75BC0|nr:methylenetetrahydrofolate reductase [Arthrobacter sp. 35W]
MFPTRVEIIPTAGIVDTVAAQLPVGSTVTVTCLPHHGIERTMAAALELAERGYAAVPHLAARAVSGKAQLRSILADCASAGITEVFTIGGDTQQPAGPYACALAMMRDIAESSGGTITMGVAGYPEGHPAIPAGVLLADLAAKAELAAGITTQMCFSADTINPYADALRREGIELPVWAGVAGAVPRTKLLALASKIGVGTSLRFLSKKASLARNMLGGERYQPEDLIDGLSPTAIAGLHLYSFNSLATLPLPALR